MERLEFGRDVELYCGHVLDVLADLPSESAQTCVTTSPYWGLRDYGVPGVEWPAVRFTPMAGLPEVDVPAWTGCLGLEPEPLAFVGHIVHVFREVRRVLKDDGTLWLNLGDSYTRAGGTGRGATSQLAGRKVASAQRQQRNVPEGLQQKQLLGIPWRVAFALQADGWWLRSDVIWAKPNPMPESVTDRPTKAHEYVFLLAKSPKYVYDRNAIEEPAVKAGRVLDYTGDQKANDADLVRQRTLPKGRKITVKETRNKRSVWTITPKPYRGAHFATMPPDLARTCILGGSRPGDIVLDPFNGVGTTGLVALQEGRRYVGCDLNPTYCVQTLERWRSEASQGVLLLRGAVSEKRRG